MTTSPFPIPLPPCSHSVFAGSFLPPVHPFLPLPPRFKDSAISLAFLLWYSLEAIFCSFPPVYSQAFFNCWLSLWAPRTSQHFFNAYLLPCVVPPSGRQVNAPASLCCSPASAPTPPPLLSPPFLLLSDSLDLGALWTGLTWIPGPWHQSSMDLPDFPSLATCLEPPSLNFPVCCASCQLLL